MGRLIQLVDWLLLSLLHCTPPTLPPFLTHLTQRLLSFKEIKSFCSPRLKTSEKDEGNCWLSSECNLRFSCILCDAINSPSPSLANVSSWLLFFSTFCNRDVDREEKMKVKMIWKTYKTTKCFLCVSWMVNYSPELYSRQSWIMSPIL
jgi:hypothetical protein